MMTSVETLPMFPLGRPCLPGEIIPLRIFEDRYLTMMDSLMKQADPEFGIVLIERGSEVGGGDVRRSVGTRMSIARIERLPGAQIAVIAVGRTRVRVNEWLLDDPFPQAVVEAMPEPDHEDRSVDASRYPRLRSVLEAADLDHVPAELRLYALASLLPIGALDLQRLLESTNQGERESLFEEILSHIEDLARFDANHPE